MSRRMGSITTTAMVCAVLGMLGAGSAAQAAVIDSFTTGGTLSTKRVATAVTASIPILDGDVALTDAYANRRVFGLGLDSAALPGADQASIQAFPNLAGGVVDYASSIGAAGKFILIYNGNVYVPGESPAVDLTAERIEIDIAAYDAPLNQPFTLTVTASVGESSVTVATATQAIGAAGTVGIDWDHFANFRRKADGFWFTFRLPAGADLRLSEIRTAPIPEPASLTAAAVLSGALLLRRRRG